MSLLPALLVGLLLLRAQVGLVDGDGPSRLAQRRGSPSGARAAAPVSPARVCVRWRVRSVCASRARAVLSRELCFLGSWPAPPVCTRAAARCGLRAAASAGAGASLLRAAPRPRAAASRCARAQGVSLHRVHPHRQLGAHLACSAQPRAAAALGAGTDGDAAAATAPLGCRPHDDGCARECHGGTSAEFMLRVQRARAARVAPRHATRYECSSRGAAAAARLGRCRHGVAPFSPMSRASKLLGAAPASIPPPRSAPSTHHSSRGARPALHVHVSFELCAAGHQGAATKCRPTHAFALAAARSCAQQGREAFPRVSCSKPSSPGAPRTDQRVHPTRPVLCCRPRASQRS